MWFYVVKSGVMSLSGFMWLKVAKSGEKRRKVGRVGKSGKKWEKVGKVVKMWKKWLKVAKSG